MLIFSLSSEQIRSREQFIFNRSFSTRSVRLIVVDIEKNTFEIGCDWSNTIFSHRFGLRGLLLHATPSLQQLIKPLKLYRNTTSALTPFHHLHINQYRMWHVVMTWQPDSSLSFESSITAPTVLELQSHSQNFSWSTFMTKIQHLSNNSLSSSNNVEMNQSTFEMV